MERSSIVDILSENADASTIPYKLLEKPKNVLEELTLHTLPTKPKDKAVSEDNAVSKDKAVSEDNAVSKDKAVSKDNAVSKDKAVSKTNAVSRDKAVTKTNAVSRDKAVTKTNAISRDKPVCKHKEQVQSCAHKCNKVAVSINFETAQNPTATEEASNGKRNAYLKCASATIVGAATVLVICVFLMRYIHDLSQRKEDELLMIGLLFLAMGLWVLFLLLVFQFFFSCPQNCQFVDEGYV